MKLLLFKKEDERTAYCISLINWSSQRKQWCSLNYQTTGHIDDTQVPAVSELRGRCRYIQDKTFSILLVFHPDFSHL